MMADDSNSDSAPSNRRSVADQVKFFENAMDNDSRSNADDESVFEIVSENRVESKVDEDKKECEQKSGTESDKYHMEHEKDKDEEEFERNNELKREENNEKQQQEEDTGKDQQEENNERHHQDEKILHSITSDKEDSADKLQPSDLEYNENVPEKGDHTEISVDEKTKYKNVDDDDKKDGDSIYKIESEGEVENKIDEDKNECEKTKGTESDKHHMEREKEEEEEFEKTNELKQEENNQQEEKILHGISSDEDDSANELQPSALEYKENVPEESGQEQISSDSEDTVGKETQRKNGKDGDDNDDNDDDDYDETDDDDQNDFYDAIDETPLETSNKETDLWKTHSDEESDRKMWECMGEPGGSEISRSEQKALWETTDDSFIVINKDEDVKPEDISIEVKNESTSETKESHLHGSESIEESESHDKVNSHENVDYTIYENYEHSLIHKETGDVYCQRWNSNSSDEEDKFNVQLEPAVSQTNVTTSEISQTNTKEQMPRQTDEDYKYSENSYKAESYKDVSKPSGHSNDECTNVDDQNTCKTEKNVDVSSEPSRLIQENQASEFSEETPVKVSIDGETHKPLEEVSSMVIEETDQKSSKQSEKSKEIEGDFPVPIKENNEVIEGTLYQNVPPQPPCIPERRPMKPTKPPKPSEKTIYQNAKPPPIPDRSYRNSMGMSVQRSVTESMPSAFTDKSSPVSMSSAATSSSSKSDIDRTSEQTEKPPQQQKQQQQPYPQQQQQQHPHPQQQHRQQHPYPQQQQQQHPYPQHQWFQQYLPRFPYGPNLQWQRYPPFMFPPTQVGSMECFPPKYDICPQTQPPHYTEKTPSQQPMGDKTAQKTLKTETAKYQMKPGQRKETGNNNETKGVDGRGRQSDKSKVPPKAKKAQVKPEKVKKQPNGLICVRGLSDNTTLETLCNYLDVVSGVDVDRSGVLYSEDHISALVPFIEPIDFGKLTNKIAERKLEGSSLEVCKVDQPRCIAISCDKAVLSDSMLINYFEIKRSGGGPVEKCQEKDGMHLIYFKDWEAVDRVCEGTRSHKIEGGKLIVSPFYVTEFGDFWNQTKHKVVIPEGFEVTNIDPHVKQFIKISNVVRAEINETLNQKHAKLSVIETLKIECLLSQKTPNIRQIVKSWKTEVQEIWNRFVKETTQKIEICVTKEVWPDLMTHVQKIEEQDQSNIIVIKERDELKLIFVGYRNVVETFTKKVKKHKADVEYRLDRVNRRETNVIQCKPMKIRLLKSTGALEKLNSTIADDFESTFDIENGEIHCAGVKEDIEKAKLMIFELLAKFYTFDFDFEDLSKNQVNLLCGDVVQEMIREELRPDEKEIEFEVCESKILIYAVNETDISSTKQILQHKVKEEAITLDASSKNVPQKQVWNDTKRRLEKDNKGKLIIEVTDDKIHITATNDIVQDIKKVLGDVITKNTIIKDKIAVPDEGIMKFVEKHCQDKFDDLENELDEESVQIKVSGNNIEISGTKEGLVQARKLLKKILSDIHHRQHDISKPGIGKVISPQNTEILNEIEDETTTIIIQGFIAPASGAGLNIEQEESEDYVDFEKSYEAEVGQDGWKHRKGKFSFGQMTNLNVGQATSAVPLQKGQVKCQNGTTIYLVKGELAKQQGDVIACSTSKDLNLKAGKAGFNILQVGGTSIQAELKQKYPEGIKRGEVAVSNGGNLQCQNIYFGSLQDWSHEKGKPVKTITTFMNNCLTKAHQSGYTSILFNALGTGALGYPRDEAAQLMYQSAMDFDKANPSSSLKTIKFVVYPKDSLTVDAFEQEEMSYINPAVKKANKKGPVTSKHGVKIIVEKGSLGKQQADVLVCATPRDLSLNSAEASKALLQDGGESIQAECSLNYPNGIKDGEIAEVGGGELSCQKLYLTSIPSWESEKSKPFEEMVVYKVISLCLDKASKAKYDSVAIPAMGTGKVKYPRKTIAKLLYNCVLKFSDRNSKSSIRTVKFVVFPKDLNTVRAFEEEEHNRLNPQINYHSGSSSVETSKCNIKISISTSSLSSAKVDVIVSSAAPGLDLNSGQTSKALLQAGGKTLQDECEANYGDGIDCGEIATVGPGKLACKQIYFGCLPKHSLDSSKAEKTLADFMKKCLAKAESSKMKSIAFASLGTGGNGYPHDVVARIMYQAVFDFDKQHSSTSIKNVHFCIYSKDYKSVQAFQTEEGKHQSTPSSGIISLSRKMLGMLGKTFSQHSDQAQQSASEQEFAVGSIMLKFCVGDLLTQKVDAIVNSTNTDLDLSRGGISLALKKKCGQTISDECNKKVEKMKKKKIVTTTGCGLSCKRIIHVDSQDSIKGWKNVMIKCLNKAEKHQFTSIAFPVFGTGDGYTNFTPESIAEIFYESVLEHSKGGDNHLKTVKIMVWKPDMAAKMVSAVTKYKPKGFIKKLTDGLGNLGLIPKPGVDSEAMINRNQRMNSVSLMIFSDSDDHIDAAINSLDNLVKEKIKEEIVRDTLIPELKDTEIQHVLAVAKKFPVKLEIDDQKCEIHVEGVHRDLVDAKDEIHKLFSGFQLERHIDTEAKMVAETVQWYCKEVSATGFDLVDYPPRLNLRFEDSLKKQLKIVEFRDPQGVEFILDLGKMKEYPKNDPSDECDVMRKELLKGETVELPPHWTNVNAQSGNVQLENVASSTKEYTDLEQKFLNSVLNGKFKDRFSKASLKVKKIERVQNESLYQQYQIKKKQLENQTPQGVQLERDLWHGTAANAIDSINYYGFNRSYCGGAGHGDCWYGDGVYFSNDGSYSARAWLSQGHGVGAANIAVGGAQTGFTGQVYVAKVLTGECILGTKGMRYLPPNTTGKIYDCAVDNVQNPVEFIIFNDTQAYPEYIITFDT